MTKYLVFLSLLWAFLAIFLAMPSLAQMQNNMLACRYFGTNSVPYYRRLLDNNPQDQKALYNLGMNLICLNLKPAGLKHLQTASDLGSPAAAAMLGGYYKSNKTFENKLITNNPQDYNLAIEYFKKAAQLIESNPYYPDADNLHHEQKSYLSYKVFISIPNLYHAAYGKNLDGKFSTDTMQILNHLKSSSETCLKQPALFAWGKQKEYIQQARQTECQAYLSFAETALLLEPKRLSAKESCKTSEQACLAYHKVLSQIIQANHEALQKILSKRAM